MKRVPGRRMGQPDDPRKYQHRDERCPAHSKGIRLFLDPARHEARGWDTNGKQYQKQGTLDLQGEVNLLPFASDNGLKFGF